MYACMYVKKLSSKITFLSFLYVCMYVFTYIHTRSLKLEPLTIYGSRCLSFFQRGTSGLLFRVLDCCTNRGIEPREHKHCFLRHQSKTITSMVHLVLTCVYVTVQLIRYTF